MQPKQWLENRKPQKTQYVGLKVPITDHVLPMASVSPMVSYITCVYKSSQSVYTSAKAQHLQYYL